MPVEMASSIPRRRGGQHGRRRSEKVHDMDQFLVQEFSLFFMSMERSILDEELHQE